MKFQTKSFVVLVSLLLLDFLVATTQQEPHVRRRTKKRNYGILSGEEEIVEDDKWTPKKGASSTEADHGKRKKNGKRDGESDNGANEGDIKPMSDTRGKKSGHRKRDANDTAESASNSNDGKKKGAVSNAKAEEEVTEIDGEANEGKTGVKSKEEIEQEVEEEEVVEEEETAENDGKANKGKAGEKSKDEIEQEVEEEEVVEEEETAEEETVEEETAEEETAEEGTAEEEMAEEETAEEGTAEEELAEEEVTEDEEENKETGGKIHLQIQASGSDPSSSTVTKEEPGSTICASCSSNDDCGGGGSCMFRGGEMRCSDADGLMPNDCACDLDEQCFSAWCNRQISPTVCQTKRSSCEVCMLGMDCESGQCLLRNNEFRCALANSKMAEGCNCEVDSHCVSGKCNTEDNLCVVLKTLGEDCVEDHDCDSSVCDSGVCTISDIGEACVFSSDCSTGRCDYVCLEKVGSCAYCNENSDCYSGACKYVNGYTVCARSDGMMDDGCHCTVGIDCASQHCETSDQTNAAYMKCTTATSTLASSDFGSSATGSECSLHSDCESGYCSRMVKNAPGMCI